MTRGTIILCGGHSRRMGSAKALLPFGPETMLARVVRLVGQTVDELVVVAAAEQSLPPLPDNVRIARDRQPDRGPLEGLATGLRALAGTVDVAFVTSCDVPLLVPDFVTRLFELIGKHDAVAPLVEDRLHPLSAVYRQSVLAAVEQQLAADRRRVTELLREIDTRYVTASEFADADPDCRSLCNINDPADYEAALAAAGFSPPT
ncbi:MAG: molybdenum cofactor guanylyltransferase [Pirellulales bacterium]|nr:molybdenum cofactor guanylyltransferase [Pirellulales bacterium]